MLGTLLIAASVAHVVGAIFFKLPLECAESYTGTDNDLHATGEIDFNQPNNADDGDPVLSSAPGVVDSIDPSQGIVRVDHGGGWMTVYAHMSNILVSADDTIRPYQQLGSISDVGVAYGEHLHYAQKINGVNVVAEFEGDEYTYSRVGTTPPPLRTTWLSATLTTTARWTTSQSPSRAALAL